MRHNVTIAETGETFVVGEEESVLAAALAANINLAHDCKSGTCATCRVRLVSGEVAYLEEPMGLLPEEAGAGFALACQARARTDLVIEAEVRPALAQPPARRAAVVSGIEPLADDVTRLTLELPDLDRFDFLPGQHIQVLMGDGRPRSFSMASAPTGNRFDLHIRRIPGGAFTDVQLPSLAEGDTLDVELPLGSFFLRKDDFRPLLMVATGTGLAPIKSVLESLMEDPDCPPSFLYWGARGPGDLYLHDEIAGWSSRLPEFEYRPVLSRPPPGWEGRRGYVQDAVVAEIDDLSEYSIYLCGSPVMVGSAKALFIERGASLNHIYADSFLFQHNR
ncbi:MAG: 2Fe-2S iron-sulfur cluster binding domain-containing protein [Bauldia sp.]|nr:2Fe-2S iron-sulfur cluster binding domain-containing protein [Bauldia sp.]